MGGEVRTKDILLSRTLADKLLLGVGDKWMSAAIQWTYELFCRVVGF